MPNNPAALDRNFGWLPSGSSGARGLSARTDIRHRELAGERAQLVQPDADDRLAALRGKPCDECRDDGARREMARPRDQQLVEDEYRERPHAHAGHHRRINPVGGDNTEDDHPHRPRLDQRHRDVYLKSLGIGWHGWDDWDGWCSATTRSGCTSAPSCTCATGQTGTTD
eukprot:gene13847-biopygen7416